MGKINYNQLIEQYLTGSITSSDKALLESQLTMDESLKAEMNWQSDMIHGLKEYRKSQLKARLNSIPVDTGVLGILGQSAFVKVASLAGVAALFVGGLYYFSGNPLNDAPVLEEITPIVVVEPLSKTGEAKIPALQKSNIQGILIENPSQKTESESINLKKQGIAARPKEDLVATVNKPTVVEFDTDKDFAAESVIAELQGGISSSVSKNLPLDIKINSKAKYKDLLRYQFYEEKLYLYGDFENVPYEILEINGKHGKKVYLYHKEAFYKLNYPIEKITDMELITDEELLRELSILRNNKAQ